MDYSKLTIYIDNREKVIGHITTVFKKLGVKWERRYLPSADYTFAYDGIDYALQWRCEKKAHYNELFNNITAKRKQFKKEFDRLIACNNVYLLIEEDNKDIAMIHLKKRNYKMQIVGFQSKLDLFIKMRQYERKQAKKDKIRVIYCNKYKTAKTILKLIENFLKTNQK